MDKLVKGIVEDLKREVNYLIEDYKMGLASESDVRNMIFELEELRNDINELIEKLASVVETPKVTEYTPTKERYKELTAHEVITVAIAQKPQAPERVKKEAEIIIKRYGLTPEEVERIYHFVFGETTPRVV